MEADFSTETLRNGRDWQDIFKVVKSKDLQLILLYLVELSFRIKGQIKSFTNKKKLKEFISTKPVLQEIVKGPSKKKKQGEEEEEQQEEER